MNSCLKPILEDEVHGMNASLKAGLQRVGNRAAKLWKGGHKGAKVSHETKQLETHPLFTADDGDKLADSQIVARVLAACEMQWRERSASFRRQPGTHLVSHTLLQ